MKVTKVKKCNDYVRFMIEVELEKKGLQIQANICGGLNDNVINGVRVQFIEDPEYDYIYKLFGEETDHHEFRELYNRLFNDSIDKLEDQMEAMCEKELHRVYPHAVQNLTYREKIKIAEETIKSCTIVESKSGKLFYTQNFYALIQTLQSIDLATPITTEGFNISGKPNKIWGINVIAVKNAINYMKQYIL